MVIRDRLRDVPLLSELAAVYPKELLRDDFATAPAVKVEAVEEDRSQDERSQVLLLHSARFLFAKYGTYWSYKKSFTVYAILYARHIPEVSPAGF